MTNAALYFHSDAYDTSGSRLMGRHSAGESFLKGFIRHSGVDRLYLWNTADQPQQKLTDIVARIEPTSTPIQWIGRKDRRAMSPVGTLHLPVAGIETEAWARETLDPALYSITGITHTTASDRVMDSLANFITSPIRPWDALICTSRAVRTGVEVELEAVREDLRKRLGATRFPQVRLETIPLGIITADFQTDEEAKRRWRAKLGIPENHVVALYVGRLSAAAKMNPGPMALALQGAVERTGRPITWVLSGWTEQNDTPEGYAAALHQLCPDVPCHVVDGRLPAVRYSIWSVGDFFISFSDNIQETFGLTPVEAMAAGMPLVVSDWDGYKDTVRHGVDGFRVPTTSPAAGWCRDLAYSYANGWVNYGYYVAATAQLTSVDIPAAVDCISALVADPGLRSTMGAAAQERATTAFDWSAIVPRYQELWRELGVRRAAASPEERASGGDNPRRLDPFELFGHYATQQLAPSTLVKAAPGMSWVEAHRRLSSSFARFATNALPSLAEAERIFTYLETHGAATIGEACAQFPPVRQTFLQRGILWLMKFGVVHLATAG